MMTPGSRHDAPRDRGMIGAMRRGFRRYPEYKDSGVASLGEIPAHWSALSVKRVCRFSYGESLASGDRRDGEVAVFGSNGAVGTNDRSNTGAPCLIVGRKGSFGKVNYSADAVFAIDTTFTIDARHTKEDLRWLYYVLQDSRLDMISKDSAIPGLDRGDAYARVIAVGPLSEQRDLAAFLDRETAKIDALVAKKERLIELLQEKRTALITRAVTRGLNPNAPMKDSGVGWLGAIPVHWQAKPLKWGIMFQRGHDLPSDEREEGDVPVVSSSGVSSTHSRAMALAPGIVTGRYGTIGNFFLIADDYWPLNTTLYSIDLRGNDPKFLRYMLEALSPLFVVNATKSAVPGVDRNDIHAIKVAIPAPEEQRAITGFIDSELAAIGVLTARVQQAIALLTEYRTALISAAVTGKIDVRSAAA